MAVAVAAAWYGVLRTGAVRVAGLALGVLGIGAAVALVARDGPLEELLAIGALVLSGVLGRAAFVVRTPLPSRPAPQRPVLFFNPKSGGGKAERFASGERGAGARDRADRAAPRRRPGAARARRPSPDGADGLAMAGGDGSQAIVAAVAAEHDLPYACIPAGTRNHFALDLGVDRDDVVGALDAFVDGGERRVDLAEVNGRVFVNNVSLGLYAEAVQRQGYREAKLRTLLDTVPDVLGPDGGGLDLRWTGPGGHEHRAGAAILVSNNRYRLGRAVGSGTRPRIDDGLLGITVAGSRRRRQRRAPAAATMARVDRARLRGRRRPPRAGGHRRRGRPARARRCGSASGPASCACASRASIPAPRPRRRCPRGSDRAARALARIAFTRTIQPTTKERRWTSSP